MTYGDHGGLSIEEKPSCSGGRSAAMVENAIVGSKRGLLTPRVQERECVCVGECPYLVPIYTFMDSQKDRKKMSALLQDWPKQART